MLETSLIVLILIGDQLTKYLTERFLPLGASYPLWEGVFEFTNVHNTGAAWGMFSGGRAFFIVITVIVCSLMLALLAKKRRELGRLARVCLSLLIAGDTLHGGASPRIGSDLNIWPESLKKLTSRHFDYFTFGHCNPQLLCDADRRIQCLAQSFANYLNPWFKDFYRSYPY